jgi:hypothetical protein
MSAAQSGWYRYEWDAQTFVPVALWIFTRADDLLSGGVGTPAIAHFSHLDHTTFEMKVILAVRHLGGSERNICVDVFHRSDSGRKLDGSNDATRKYTRLFKHAAQKNALARGLINF